MKKFILLPVSFFFIFTYTVKTYCSDNKIFNTFFNLTGLATISGGYENLVAAGQTEEGLDVIIGGGNHGTGDLGLTFPWITYNEQNLSDNSLPMQPSEKLSVMGFNDMMIYVDNSVFIYKESFDELNINDQKPGKKLKIHYEETNSSDKKIDFISIKVPVQEYKIIEKEFLKVENQSTKMALRFYVRSQNPTLKREGGRKVDLINYLANSEFCKETEYKSDEILKICRILSSVDKSKYYKELKPIGLTLNEHPFVLEDNKSLKGEIVISRSKNGIDYIERKYNLKSLRGAVEKSDLTILASTHKALQFHMKYDYITLHPFVFKNRGTQCSHSVVMYISGLLNPDSGKLHSHVNKFSRISGSSVFIIDKDGKDYEVEQLSKRFNLSDNNPKSIHGFKNIEDVISIHELGLNKNKNHYTFQSVIHRIGPGVFDRRLVLVEDQNGCKYGGMLENQALR